MAGAIAGTALFNLRKTNGIDLVTLTVNNACNLSCHHCYLQYHGENGYANDEVLDTITNAQFRHLAIVGKEPLFNKDHAKKTSELIERVRKSSKTISLITNGLNLDYLQNNDYLKFVDVSLDGGSKTYKRASYDSLMKKINNSGIANVNALHTVYQQNVNNISDMARVAEDAPFKIVLFSPYLATKNQGSNSVDQVEINKLLEKFSESKEFMDEKNTLLNLDLFHAKQAGMMMQQIKTRITELGLQDKVKLFETDLLKEGVVRVTYDGFVLSPEESLHTANYSGKVRLNGNLTDAYDSVLNKDE